MKRDAAIAGLAQCADAMRARGVASTYLLARLVAMKRVWIGRVLQFEL